MYEGKFAVPGPGSWELETTHLSRPLSRWMAAVWPAAMMQGFRAGSAEYGMLLDYLEVAIVDGFAYMCPRPVGAPKGAKGPPPKFVFKMLSRLHPALRKRNKRAGEVFATKFWREDLRQWDATWKPAIVATNAALAAIDPATLDVPALIAHLEAVQTQLTKCIVQHHRLNPCAMLPTGDFLVHAKGWTKKSSRELLGLLRGSSPVSVGATEELARLVAALRADPGARAAVESTAPAAETMAALRGHAGEVGAAMRAYVDVVGLRIISSYAPADQYALEIPEVLICTIKAAVAATERPSEAAAVAAETARVRDAVPEPHRAEFDALLAEARAVYRVRDERCYLSDAFAVGIARRALLSAGDRLAAAGKLASRDHVCELLPGEVLAMLRGEPGPAVAETAAYATYRATRSVADAPALLGFPKSGPPPAEWLPPEAARMMRAIGAILCEMFDVAEKDTASKVVRGLAASPGSYEGRARLVLGADQFSRIEKGDVLIARTTSPAYNVLLPLIGGIVTDRGGLLSHAAIVAREYGMPAVVGTTDGTTHVPDGARVRVDGATGEVRILS